MNKKFFSVITYDERITPRFKLSTESSRWFCFRFNRTVYRFLYLPIGWSGYYAHEISLVRDLLQDLVDSNKSIMSFGFE